jgi:hypothetical protein
MTPTALELRRQEIPRSPLVKALEQKTGKSITHDFRHFLANKAVHCGEFLELYHNDTWILGRYEWTADPKDAPSLTTDEETFFLDENRLLRWPKND